MCEHPKITGVFENSHARVEGFFTCGPHHVGGPEKAGCISEFVSKCILFVCVCVCVFSVCIATCRCP